MAKFTEKHPEIKVELAEEGKWLGTEDLAKLAAANKMPDIINVENIYTPVKNNWLMDISSYYQNDPDKAAIYENFIEFGSIGGKLYVLPSNVFFHGIKVNLTLLEDLNIPKPGYDWTIDDFMNILKASSVKGESIGTNNIIWLMKHLPAQMNDELGWAAYNYSTQTYSLGNEWIETVNKMKDIVDKEYVIWENIDKLGKPDDFEEDSADYNAVVEKRNDYLMKAVGTTEVPWPLGKVAMQEDFSWTLRFDKTDPSYTGFDWDYYPFPSSGAGDVSRPGLSVDYYGITTSCKNPDAAWELIKYMSYDLEGFRDKVGIVNAYDKEVTTVYLKEGKVRLTERVTGRQNRYLMAPDEMLAVDRNARTCRAVRPAGKSAPEAWLHNNYAFTNAPLEDVVEFLERHYAVEIEVADARILQYSYTMEFYNETIDEVLSVMSQITPIRYSRVNDRITVRAAR